MNWPQEQQSWWPSPRREDDRRLWGWWRKSFIGVLGALEQCRCRKSRVGAVEWCDEEGVPEKELFIGQNGQGQIWLISSPYPWNRGYSGRYGNCSHCNQGIVQVIWLEAVMIWRYFTVRDFLVGPSAASSNGQIADRRIKWGCPLSDLGGWEILGVCERIRPRLFGFNDQLPNWED